MKKDMLIELAEKGEMFGFTAQGQLITVQEILQFELKREVGWDEAIAYIRQAQKKRFLSRFQRYAHFTPRKTA